MDDLTSDASYVNVAMETNQQKTSVEIHRTFEEEKSADNNNSKKEKEKQSITVCITRKWVAVVHSASLITISYIMNLCIQTPVISLTYYGVTQNIYNINMYLYKSAHSWQTAVFLATYRFLVLLLRTTIIYL